MSPDPRVSLFHEYPSELGEGILWHPVTQTLWWADITQKQILEVDRTGKRLRIFDVGKMVSTLTPTADGKLVIALQDGIYHFDPATGQTRLLARPPEHDAGKIRFNDGKCDPRGRLLVGSIALDGTKEAARLYRVDADGSTHVLRARVSISNGLAWSPDQRTLYYIDTPTGLVQIFDYDLETGAIRASQPALNVTSAGEYPDGCTIDTQGRLWIAHWGGHCVSCWDPQTGRQVDQVRVPASQVTNCTFGGPNLDQLYITTARIGLAGEQLQNEPLAGSVFRAEINARGMPAAFAALR